jgi:hypothetical protein
MNTEQAIARLMGEDLHVWNPCPGSGDGADYPTGQDYGDGYGEGDGIGYGRGYSYPGYGSGYGCCRGGGGSFAP